MRKSVTYIVSNVDKAIAFEWIVESTKNGPIEIDFILLGTKKGHLYSWLKETRVPVRFYRYNGKKLLLKCFLQIWFQLIKSRPKVVHTHLFEANVIGLTAALFAGVSSRIYTRHHSTYHHEFFKKAVKWDLFMNKIASKVIAITSNVEEVLIEKEGLAKNKVAVIHHGFKLEQFQDVPITEVEELRSKYQLTNPNQFIVGVISRYIHWKGIQYIIPAFKKIKEQIPTAKLILANASGPDATRIKRELQEHLVAEDYLEITFENNLFALYKLFNVYVHCPINAQIEAFGQTYVEALASGVPAVVTLSGIGNDFIKHNYNALVVPYENSEAIAEAILRYKNEEYLSEEISRNGKKSVAQFALKEMVDKLCELYEE